MLLPPNPAYYSVDEGQYLVALRRDGREVGRKRFPAGVVAAYPTPQGVLTVTHDPAALPGQEATYNPVTTNRSSLWFGPTRLHVAFTIRHVVFSPNRRRFVALGDRYPEGASSPLRLVIGSLSTVLRGRTGEVTRRNADEPKSTPGVKFGRVDLRYRVAITNDGTAFVTRGDGVVMAESGGVWSDTGWRKVYAFDSRHARLFLREGAYLRVAPIREDRKIVRGGRIGPFLPGEGITVSPGGRVMGLGSRPGERSQAPILRRLETAMTNAPGTGPKSFKVGYDLAWLNDHTVAWTEWKPNGRGLTDPVIGVDVDSGKGGRVAYRTNYPYYALLPER